jgi:hypothetical protein
MAIEIKVLGSKDALGSGDGASRATSTSLFGRTSARR